jgi:hypothetical protein
MKLYGSIKELFSAVFRKNNNEITLRPNQSTTYTSARDIQLPEGDADHVVVSRTSTDTLTNKTLTSPTLVTPALGTPSSGTLTNATGLPIDGGTVGTLPVLRGGTGTTTSTGTGSVVLSNSPSLVTPALGTPSSATLTNATGLPIVAGTTGTLSVARGGTGTTTSTGSGSVVLSSSPALTTPDLGTPSAVTLTNATGLPIGSGTTGTLAINRGGTGSTDATSAFDALAPTTTKGDIIAHNGSDNIRLPVGANNQALVADSTQTSGLRWATVGGDISNGGNSFGSAITLGTNDTFALNLETDATTRVSISSGGAITFPNASMTSAALSGVLSDETGSGSAVFATSPTLVTPNLGTPSAVNLTNGTSLPISTGVSGLAAGVATFLGTPSSANLASAVTDETGSGALVFGTSPTFTTTINAPSGNASTPGLAWSADADGSGTGLYRSAANATSFANNGTLTGTVASTGAWTIGPDGGPGTAAGAYHTTHGTVVDRFNSASGTGAYSARTSLFLNSNQYFDGAGTSKAIVTGSGYTYANLTTSTAVDSTVVVKFATNSTSQTADAATSGIDSNLLTIAANGATNLPGIHNVGSGNITSGTYSPTITNTTNVSASTNNGAQYMRVGNVVTVSGTMDVTITTAAGTATDIGISLPIASNFANGNQASGIVSVSSSSGTGYSSGYIFSDATNDRARVNFNAAASGTRTLQYHFTYQII